MKKIAVITISVLISFVIILGGVFFFLLSSWAKTEYGKLDLNMAFVLKVIELSGDNDKTSYPVEKQREDMIASMNDPIFGTPRSINYIKDMTIPGPGGEIPIRIYRNSDKTGLPVMLFFHGGGFVVGDLETTDFVVRYMAEKGDALLISVDYRLAPEFPFPAAIDDGFAALEWAARNAEEYGGDPAKIGVAGDSAGANISAVLSLMTRDRNGPKISFQGLIYPVTNLYTLDTPSMEYFAKGFLLTKADIEWYREQYLPNIPDRKNPYASPLLAESFNNLPPAAIVTAFFDPLRDEGEAYGDKLEKAGIPVEVKRYYGVTHGFSSLGDLTEKSYDSLDFIMDRFMIAIE